MNAQFGIQILGVGKNPMRNCAKDLVNLAPLKIQIAVAKRLLKQTVASGFVCYAGIKSTNLCWCWYPSMLIFKDEKSLWGFESTTHYEF